jgi:cell division protein FtsW (lipid II flippase)
MIAENDHSETCKELFLQVLFGFILLSLLLQFVQTDFGKLILVFLFSLFLFCNPQVNLLVNRKKVARETNIGKIL